MENYQGDLTDIIRGGVSVTTGSTTTTTAREATTAQDGKFPSNPTNYSSLIEERVDDFGDPFSNIGDPLLLHDINIPTSPVFLPIPCNTSIYSRMLPLPVSPCESPVVVGSGVSCSSTTSLISDDLINSSNSKNCSLQISSPRITGVKRRKSQAKKVVCIPAAAPANSKSSGEIVPSDLWAWRKYGQKPIKGSPFPRGYYRCSSSKGCSARKQVERSRTDPNMLVITYTSEHNHPWPTQRNALAGSTRSQPTKNNNNNSTSKSSQSQDHKDHTSLKMNNEQKQSNMINDNDASSYSPVFHANSRIDSAVKEEIIMEDFQKEMEMQDVDQFVDAFQQSYKPALPDSNMQPDDFFADLGEIEVGPLNDLLFDQGFSGDEGRGDKALDPFSFYD